MNKVDLPGAEPERSGEEIAELIGEDPEQVRRISARNRRGRPRRARADHAARPAAPPATRTRRRAMIFDSQYGQYRDMIAYIRGVDGTFKKGETILGLQTEHAGRDRRHRLLPAHSSCPSQAARPRRRWAT